MSHRRPPSALRTSLNLVPKQYPTKVFFLEDAAVRVGKKYFEPLFRLWKKVMLDSVDVENKILKTWTFGNGYFGDVELLDDYN